jgi:hypothetical protein
MVFCSLVPSSLRTLSASSSTISGLHPFDIQGAFVRHSCFIMSRRTLIFHVCKDR